jgi:hypothetical protein
MECLITLGGIFVALAVLAVLALLVQVVDGNPCLSASRPRPEGETVGERLTQVVTMAPLVLDTDPEMITLTITRQIVEEQADAATLEVLGNIDEILGGNTYDDKS